MSRGSFTRVHRLPTMRAARFFWSPATRQAGGVAFQAIQFLVQSGLVHRLPQCTPLAPSGRLHKRQVAGIVRGRLPVALQGCSCEATHDS